MPYTRRSVLRDAALLSVATVASSSATLLSGCKKTGIGSAASRPPNAAPMSEPSAATGTARVFFAGSWLFCADDAKGWMRAVTKTYAKHRYRYGNYTTLQGDINGRGKDLPTTGKTYDIQLSAFSANKAETANDLFAQMVNQLPGSPFTYMPNASKSLRVDFTRSDLYTIRMPIPTRLIPAAFVLNASFTDTDGYIAPTQPVGGTNAFGLATTHIFEYGSATNLSFFDVDGTTRLAGALAGEDFHIHTSPENNNLPHNAMMFGNLMGSIDGLKNKPQLNLVQCPIVYQGPDIPSGVTPRELEMQEPPILCLSQAQSKAEPIHRSSTGGTLASCAGGGIGLGGDCCP